MAAPESEISRASHWLHDEPESFDQARMEVQRLQRTILCLIAIGITTETKATQAYEIAGW